MKRLIVAVATLVLALPGCSDEPAPKSEFDGMRAFRDLRAQVEIGPRPAGSRGGAEVVRLIAGRLRAAGTEDVRVQRPWRNVVATIPGSAPGVIVVGAHHDTKTGVGPDFAGANDGASGVAVVLELARVLADDAPRSGPSIRIALFDAEEARGDRPFDEDGTRGSRQYVAYAERGAQGSPPLDEIRAMVLFDLVGDCDLQIPYEAGSDPGLYAEFAEAAEMVDGSPSPFIGETAGVMDDHLPFLARGIPAVGLIDFTYG
ncbi:MAG: M28 family peptidase, partial [Actinomycetota bacterium]|nr:M28 family peptidase [Actinomycetota bacterium]